MEKRKALLRCGLIIVVASSITMSGAGFGAAVRSTPSSSTTDETITLWPDGAPGAVGKEPGDIPTLTRYTPKEKATRSAVIVCPGGGYRNLADHEGRPVAEWLNSIGITAFVLKYRIGPRYHHPAPLQDAARAIRLVRRGPPILCLIS